MERYYRRIDTPVNEMEESQKWKAVSRHNPAIKRSHYIYGPRPDDPGRLTPLGLLRHKLQYLRQEFRDGSISFNGREIEVRKETRLTSVTDWNAINSQLRGLPPNVARMVIEDAQRYLTVQEEVDKQYRYDLRENRDEVNR